MKYRLTINFNLFKIIPTGDCMDKENKIKELIDILLKLRPSFQKNIGKNRMFNTLKSGIKLGTNQQLCMNLIHDNNGISMSELAKKMGVSNQQNTRIVSDLEAYGFIKRERDSNNKRTILAYETEAGKNYYHELFESMNKTAQEIFSELDDAVLDKLLEHFKEILKIIVQIG